MENIIVGLVPAPELPAKLVYKLSGSLEKKLQEEFPKDACWKVKIEVDQLTGAADNLKEIMDETKRIKETNSWSYAISLTDLPISHYSKNGIHGKTRWYLGQIPP